MTRARVGPAGWSADVDELLARIADEQDRLRRLSDRNCRNLAAGHHAPARVDFEQLLVILGRHVAAEESSLFPMLRRDGGRHGGGTAPGRWFTSSTSTCTRKTSTWSRCHRQRL
jgi:hypothetical protein